MKLKELRIQNGLNQKDLAKIVNTSQRTISNYEKENGTEPTLDMLKKFANYFNVSLDFLCDRQWNNQIGYIPDDKKELVSLILDLDKDETKEIMAYIKGYISGRNKDANETFKVFDD